MSAGAGVQEKVTLLGEALVVPSAGVMVAPGGRPWWLTRSGRPLGSVPTNEAVNSRFGAMTMEPLVPVTVGGWFVSEPASSMMKSSGTSPLVPVVFPARRSSMMTCSANFCPLRPPTVFQFSTPPAETLIRLPPTDGRVKMEDSALVASRTVKASPSGSTMGSAMELFVPACIWRMTGAVVTGEPVLVGSRKSTIRVNVSLSSAAFTREPIRQQDEPRTWKTPFDG